MEQIKMILRKRISCDEKIKLIKLYITEGKENNLGHHKLVKLTDTELKDLNKTYGDQVIKNIIETLDSYIYSKGNNYKKHKSVIMNWLRRAGVKKIPKTYTCSFGSVHRQGEKCTCGIF